MYEKELQILILNFLFFEVKLVTSELRKAWLMCLRQVLQDCDFWWSINTYTSACVPKDVRDCL